MRILTAEFRKTFTLRFFLILLVAVAANFLLFMNGAGHDDDNYSHEDAVALQREVISMGSNGYNYMEKQLEMLEACQGWEDYNKAVQYGFSAPEITEEMVKYQEVYKNGSYLRYSEDLYTERELFQSVYGEMLRVANHKETLQSAIEAAQKNISFPIFAKPGTFAYRNQLAAIDRLEDLLYIQPKYDLSDGVLNAQRSAVTDLLGLMLILFFCTELVVTEQRNGMIPILRATKKGRLPLIASKATASFMVAFFVVSALWGINLLYCGITVGLGDLSRPVQSLTGFTTCTLELSVGMYIVLFFLSKWLLYTLVGLFCMICGLLFQNAMYTWMTVGGFLSGEYILAQTIESFSAWNILKYANVSNLIFNLDWMSEYRNLNFGSHPIDILTVSVVLLSALLVGSVVILCWLFCRRLKSIALPKVSITWPKWLPRPGKSTALVGHELWKLLIECGALLVLVVFVLINIQEPHRLRYSNDEAYYKYYMEMLQGPITSDTDARIAAAEESFQDIRDEIGFLRKQCAEGKLSTAELDVLLTPLNWQLEAEEVLRNRVIPKVERAKQLSAEGKKVWLLYERGYEYILGFEHVHDKAGASAMLIAGIILCFSNFYPLETSSGMLPLLNVYKRGRISTAKTKFFICIAITGVMFLVAQIPDYWHVFRNYGFPLLNAPLCSIEGFTAWSDGISIWGGILIFEGLRLMTALSVMAIVVAVCLWTKNQIVTMSATTGVILLPLLLNLLDITFLNKVSFYLPLNSIVLLTHQEGVSKAFLYYGIVLLLGVFSILFTFRYVGCGYQHKLLQRR